jgi:transposase
LEEAACGAEASEQRFLDEKRVSAWERCWNENCTIRTTINIEFLDEKMMSGKLSIEQIRDIEQLRQIALLLEREVEYLLGRIRKLTEQLAQATGSDAGKLQQEIELLQQQLDRRTRELYGTSSEKRPAAKQPSDDESKKKRRGHGPRPQPNLPIIEEIHELDEADTICPRCGKPLKELAGQYEESDEIDVIHKEYKIVRHKRKKYVCECGEVVETALGPRKLIPGGRYSVDFAVDVAIDKYSDHLPLARQVKQMARAGLEVDAQTLWDQLWAMHGHLRPTYEALHDYILSSPVIGADETKWRLLGGSKLWWAWSVTRQDAVLYLIQPTRSAEGAEQVLKNYHGIVVADGYSAYGALETQKQLRILDGPCFTLAKCWAHARRKFVECEPHVPEEAGKALEILGRLYKVEAEAAKQTADMNERERLETIAALRNQKSRGIVKEFFSWVSTQEALPRSGLGRALGYALEHKEGLKRFLDDPRIPIDNNATEREMRPLAVGRKNHYGSKSLRGTQVAALFYSLIESARMSGLNPVEYLTTALHRAIDNPGTVLLPRDLVQEKASL